ncbi:hypothetical protein llap_17054 [Limosa lapponica baueri]|uniref:Uncharacterized protein n=1 Tax=Limosa lapponica baueri TaxID=1758121 RepID=A0A2I0TFW1_LIMLA|nr:hypothetical protein llap_17054 [Limosa lapponica baueri]
MRAYALCPIKPTSELGLLLKKTPRKRDEMSSSATLTHQREGFGRENMFYNRRREIMKMVWKHRWRKRQMKNKKKEEKKKAKKKKEQQERGKNE